MTRTREGGAAPSASGASVTSPRSRLRLRAFGSPKSRAGTEGGKPDAKLSLPEQAARYCVELKADEALEGTAIGQKKYQANRVLNALDAQGKMDIPEFIALKAHLAFVERCEHLSALPALEALKEPERHEFCAEVCERMTVPPAFQLNLLTVTLSKRRLERQQCSGRVDGVDTAIS